MGQILLPEGAPQGTPPSGYTTIYAKVDGKIYYKTDAGIEVMLTDVGFYQDVVLTAAQNHGIKVDQTTPVFTWADLEGDITPKTTGATAPTYGALVSGGNTRVWFYDASDIVDCNYHIPHDWVMGSNCFIHLHWGHNGTAVSGNITATVSMNYAKGHNQSTFMASDLVWTMTCPATNLTVAPRNSHIVSEFQISSATPTATQFNSNVFEPDGKLLVNVTSTGIPTISGGTINTPYWIGLDIHYQSTSIGTINKAPNFWGA
jgi:hypothetical protein